MFRMPSRSNSVIPLSDSARLIARSKQRMRENRELAQSLVEYRWQLRATREENRRLRDDLRYLRAIVCTGPVLSRLKEIDLTVWRLTAEGLSIGQIASELQTDVTTALAHRSELMSKLDIHNLATLTRLAVRRKLVAV